MRVVDAGGETGLAKYVARRLRAATDRKVRVGVRPTGGKETTCRLEGEIEVFDDHLILQASVLDGDQSLGSAWEIVVHSSCPPRS